MMKIINFFTHNFNKYWIINSPDLEAIQNFGMTKSKKDHSKLVKDNDAQSVTSEKEQSDSESEKLERGEEDNKVNIYSLRGVCLFMSSYMCL